MAWKEDRPRLALLAGLLVIICATPQGKKELVAPIDGVRERTQSWKELLLDLKRRGLVMAPELAVPTARLGFGRRSRKCDSSGNAAVTSCSQTAFADEGGESF
jgi:hypothetical protein